MVIDRREKFIAGEGITKEGLSIPKRLKSVVANAPTDQADTDAYLSGLVRAGQITTDDVTFLIDSGALQN